MNQHSSKFLAAFLIFPGMWNLVLPSQTPALPPLPEGRLGGVQAVLVAARPDQPAPGLPLADEREPRRVIWVLATAYTSSVDETDDTPFITASGTTTHAGTIAANFLYFGTRARIPDYFGDFIFTVEDRMNERYGSGRIDIWMPTKAQAREWGARWVQIELY